MRYYYGGPGMSWYPMFGFLMMLVFIGLVILLVSFFLRRPIRHMGMHDHELPGRATSNASKILDERLARGEISVEEYNQLKDVINKRREE